jgi:hypothetical protein
VPIIRSRHAASVLAAGLALFIASAALAQGTADSTRARGTAAAMPAEPIDLRATQGWQQGPFAPDKLQHFSLAFSLGLAFGIMSGEPAAAGGAAVLAVGKELADARRTRFDGVDLAAGLVGAGCAALLIVFLER